MAETHTKRTTRRKQANPTGAAARARLRATIAVDAARLISEGLTDIGEAKRKAAAHLGLTGDDALPGNNEVQMALREYQALFASGKQPAALAALQAAAISAMRWLGTFSPWVSGAVLNGTANEYNAIELEIVGADSKSFEMFLLNQKTEFELEMLSASGMSSTRNHAHLKSQRHESPLRYRLFVGDAPIEITLFESTSQQLATFPKSSPRYERAQIAEAMRRFAAK